MSLNDVSVGQMIVLCRLPALPEGGRPRSAMVCPTKVNSVAVSPHRMSRLSRLVRRKRVVFRIQGKVGLAHLAGTHRVCAAQVSGRPPDEQVLGQLHAEMVGGFRKPEELK